jgi:UDP-N-acetylglucosamine 2-epimerase (non-hydrolysing)
LHRPSNVDDPSRLKALADYLDDVATRIEVVFPIHPRTDARLVATGLKERLAANPRVHLTSPLGYREFIDIVAGATVVITDSGGVQEETSFLGIPCVTLRTTTERPITTSVGTNHLVGDDLMTARAATWLALQTGATTKPTIPGWDGHAAERIVDAIVAALSC